MKGYANWLTMIVFGITLVCFISPAQVRALPPQFWIPGSERQFFGHTFDEEMWTNDSIIFENENFTVQFIASYVNYTESMGHYQAMLIALGVIENTTGTQSTLPYQLFGLHYTTSQGQDVFFGSLLAFLFGYNDTDHNGIPSPGENRFYIIPYGYNEGSTNASLSIEAISAKNFGPGHFQFGIRYRNLYGRLVSANDELGFLITLLKPLLEITFSELTITYDIQVDTNTGEITTETFYTIGQITDLRILGISIPNHHQYLKDIGIGVAHIGVIFTPRYYVHTFEPTPVSAEHSNLANISTDLRGQKRIFALTTRGTYNVINESTWPATPIYTDLPAYSWILTPQPTDVFLMAWQLPISADIFSIFAYAMSPYLQSIFTGPLHLYNHADIAFNSAAFWFGVAFPESHGYRIEHDPVYTAFSNIGQGSQLPKWLGLVLLGSITLVGLIVIVIAIIRINGREKQF